MLQILIFEIRYRLNRPATYIYFGILFLISFLIVALPGSSMTEAGEQLHKNAPYIISQLISGLLLFSSIIVAGIMGVPVYRDFNYNFNEIVFSLPIKKWEYLGGRFLGSYIITLFVHMGLVLGIMVATFMPWIEKGDLGPFTIEAYLNPIFVFLIPNLFILGVIFFAIGSIFKTQLAIYTQGLIFLVLYFALNTLMADVDTNPINSIFEPFGSVALSFETKYWTTFEKNNDFLPFAGYILINRLVWISFASILGLASYFIFKPTPFSLFTSRKQPNLLQTERIGTRGFSIPIAHASYNVKAQISQWWYLSRFHATKILKAIPFIIMLACGVGLLLLARFGMSMMGSTQLPVTYMLLDFLQGTFMIFAIIIITVYTGELIWKDIDVKFAPVIDAAPISDRLVVLSKFSAMILVELFALFFIMLTGIGVQIFNGFFDFQILIYFKVLMLNTFPYLALLTFLVFLIHTLINNKYLGHTIVVVFFALNIFSGQIGLNHVLTKYGSSIEKSYSAMNGFHNFVFPALVVDSYWLMLGIIFLTFSILLIKRGNELGIKSRVRNMRVNWKASQARFVIPIALLAFILIGSFVYYNTNILNTYRTKKERRAFKSEYELKYSKYKDYPQPRITDVKISADLFPEDLKFDIRGTFQLTNKNNVALDTIHLRTNPSISINKVNFSIPMELVDSSKEHGYYIYKVQNPINPGDKFSLEFDYTFKEKGFHHWGHGTDIVYNGSFIHAQYLPSFGYNEDQELTDKKDRKKAGLPKKEYESPEITDTAKYKDTYISDHADRISYEAIISTHPDQIAITCGTKVKEWMENGRRYSHYKMTQPIWNFYPFLSAKYEVLEEDYNGLNISIFYHKGHDYNLDKMVKGIKRTVDYCSKNFHPYQHDTIRIVEFPRYGGFAQSFAGTIPFSEGLGFIMDIDSKRDIDVPFFVTAHEVAHQWWGHLICAADVKGKTMLVESLAEYTALMVMLKEYGEEQAGKFIKYEADRYMLMRATEKKKEPPLYLVDDEQYLSYQKGCLAFYNIQDNIGEDSLSAALSRFITDYQYKEAPYPTSIDLLRYIKEIVPDSLQYMVTDWFETITLYSNRTDSVQYKEMDNGKYLVQINTTSKKYQADSLGKQEALDLNDWLEIGVYSDFESKKDSLIYLEKVLVTDKNSTFEVVVDSKPSKAGIDPLNKQIDRNLLDNTKVAETGS